ncbi:hypothetical protein [Pseudomarimonas arenosa]|uniref:DUF3108 domain-containing protein n=1 Tax=Pseudomarimonas arenosa TaxID=2774145 RepID=A0AAW3ZRX9_9GAMM|nr:hypothetical protein [Pseudomarimonas arenosa]MBD8528214.1 hypothetical protein [Pseudomarimonas arenosa]
MHCNSDSFRLNGSSLVRKLTLALGAAAILAVGKVSAAPLDLESLAARLPDMGEIHLHMFKAEQADGYMRLGWKQDGQELHVFDRTMMPSAEIYEAFNARLDAASLQPKQVEIEFHSGLQTLKVDYRSASGNGVLSRELLSPVAEPKRSEAELELAPGVLLRAFSFLLPLVDDSAVGDTIEYTWFEPMSREPTAAVRLHVAEGGPVQAGDSALDTLRYELRGSSPENDIYVSKQTPRKVLRIDVLGTDLQFRAPATP